MAGRGSKAEREKRLTIIVKQLGNRVPGREIAKELGISERSYYSDLQLIRKRLESKNYVTEACVRLLSSKERTVDEAEDLLESTDNESIKVNALRAKIQATESLEKMYSRFGIIPRETQGLELSGEVKTGLTRKEVIELAKQYTKE